MACSSGQGQQGRAWMRGVAWVCFNTGVLQPGQRLPAPVLVAMPIAIAAYQGAWVCRWRCSHRSNCLGSCGPRGRRWAASRAPPGS